MTKKKKLIIIAVASLSLIALGAGLFALNNIRSEKAAVTVDQTQLEQEPAELTPEPVQPGATDQPAADQSQPLLVGQFRDADAVHNGEGTAIIEKSGDKILLKFSEDFKTTRGPDVFVYLSPNADGELGDFASLGEIQSFSGAQTYLAPDNYQDYKRVVLWCRAFSTPFAYANLN